MENKQILALESNKRIQKLENQLEEERQLKYSFDIATNDRQNVNPQEATFKEEALNINQQQKKNQPTETEVNHKEITEWKKDREEELPKKGF